jgi:hypothetical protein
MTHTFTDTNRYKIVRIFANRERKVTIHRNLTLMEAQEHCRDPQTSSAGCTTKTGKARTRNYGPWFDSYCLDN